MIIAAQMTADRVAITVSSLCAVHCLLTPAFLILTSGFISLSVNNELIHSYILMVAIPVSVVALTLGQRNHRTVAIFMIGLLGLVVLSTAWFLGEPRIGEYGEKALTVLGSILVVYAHYRNYCICRQINCDCCLAQDSEKG